MGDLGVGGSGVKVFVFDKCGFEFVFVVVGDCYWGSSIVGVLVIYVCKFDED